MSKGDFFTQNTILISFIIINPGDNNFTTAYVYRKLPILHKRESKSNILYHAGPRDLPGRDQPRHSAPELGQKGVGRRLRIHAPGRHRTRHPYPVRYRPDIVVIKPGSNDFSTVILPGATNWDSDMGANYHPNHHGHRKLAMSVIPYIATITGWELPDTSVE